MISVIGGPYHRTLIGHAHLSEWSEKRGGFPWSAGDVVPLWHGPVSKPDAPRYRLRHLMSLPAGPWLSATFEEKP